MFVPWAFVRHADGGGFGAYGWELPSEPQPVRIADLWAVELAPHVGVEFSLSWNEARRDRSIEDVRTRLR